MKHYIRPSTVIAYAVGMTVASLGIAAVATFGTRAADHLPACQTFAVEYVEAPQ